MNEIDIRTSGYFSGPGFSFGMVWLLLGMFVASKSVVLLVILVGIGSVFALTQKGFRIDPVAKTYQQYYRIAWLKLGERTPFEEIQYLFIKKGKVSQTMNSRVSTSTIHSEEYRGYIKFSEAEKVQIYAHKDKDRVLKKLQPLSKGLSLRIVEYDS